MFRRCIRDLPSVRSLNRTSPRIASQTPYILSRNEFSTATPKPSSQKEDKKSGGGLLIGGLLLGFAAGGALAYNNGYLDFIFNKSPLKIPTQQKNEEISQKNEIFEVKEAPVESKIENGIVRNENVISAIEELEKEVDKIEDDKKDQDVILDIEKDQSENLDKEEVKDREEVTVSENNTINEIKSEKNEEINEIKSEKNEKNDEISVPVSKEESGTIDSIPSESENIEISKGPKESLLDSYSLQEEKQKPEEKDEIADVSMAKNENEIIFEKSDKENIMLDLVEAIHAAERKQAESDAYIFAEEKRRLKEKYEKELKDVRARQLMFAEEVAMLEKELNKEKAKALSAMKSLQEKADKALAEQLQQKQEEMEKQLEKTKELAKAELAAAISKEKALQIERISEANLNINALCMAFYARSEEARQSHSVHNLALATLGMEEALSKGLPLKGQVDSLRESLQSIDEDSLLRLAVSSLPKEALEYGTDTQMELSIKFNALKGILRHFSLIPAGGGGMLTHAVARLASSIKMRENDESGDGIESLITRVEKLIINGQLAEAADELELGLTGTEAEEAVKQWAQQARARVIAEQTLSLLQSYASSISSFSS